MFEKRFPCGFVAGTPDAAREHERTCDTCRTPAPPTREAIVAFLARWAEDGYEYDCQCATAFKGRHQGEDGCPVTHVARAAARLLEEQGEGLRGAAASVEGARKEASYWKQCRDDEVRNAQNAEDRAEAAEAQVARLTAERDKWEDVAEAIVLGASPEFAVECYRVIAEAGLTLTPPSGSER